MNVVSIVGRLTHSPELRHTNSGKAVCSFSVAVERRFKDPDGNAITDYIDCVVWNQSAEFLCKWFDKGVRVALTGEMQTRTYEKDGQKHKVTEVVVSTVEFADGKREANNTTTATNNDNAVTDISDDFVPLDDGGPLPWDVQ